jgi:hypothetical protein
MCVANSALDETDVTAVTSCTACSNTEKAVNFSDTIYLFILFHSHDKLLICLNSSQWLVFVKVSLCFVGCSIRV